MEFKENSFQRFVISTLYPMFHSYRSVIAKRSLGMLMPKKSFFFRFELSKLLVDDIKYIWKLNSEKNFEKIFRHLRAWFSHFFHFIIARIEGLGPTNNLITTVACADLRVTCFIPLKVAVTSKIRPKKWKFKVKNFFVFFCPKINPKVLNGLFENICSNILA